MNGPPHGRAWREALGERMDRIARDTFDVVRWITMVAFARYLWRTQGEFAFAALYWALALALFVFLMSRFLLRGEIVLFRPADTRAKRLLTHAFNALVCLVAFALALWVVETLVEAFARNPTAMRPR